MSPETEKAKVGPSPSTTFKISFISGLVNGKPLVEKNQTQRAKYHHGKREKQEIASMPPMQVTAETSDGGYLASSSSSEASDDEITGLVISTTSDDSLEVETSGSEEDKATTIKSIKTQDAKSEDFGARPHRTKQPCLKQKCWRRTSCLKKLSGKSGNRLCLKNQDETSEDEDTEASVATGTAKQSRKKCKGSIKKHGKKSRRSKTDKRKHRMEETKGETSTRASTADDTSITAESLDVEMTMGGEDEPGVAVTEKEARTSSDMDIVPTGTEIDAFVNVDGRTAVKDTSSTSASTSRKNGEDDWTESQDAAIMAMKESNETWGSIGKAVGRGKKEVQKRYKELTARLSTSKTAISDTTDTGNDGDNEMTDAKLNRSNKNFDSNNRSLRSVHDVFHPAEWSSDQEADPHRALARQQDLAFRNMYGEHYNVRQWSGKINPDRQFSERDCEMLAMLATKRKTERWLDLQGAFFNATGRMVSVEVLKHKMAHVLESSDEGQTRSTA